MTSGYYRKPHRYKKRKPILRKRFFWPGILIVLILFSTFYFLFFSHTFQVKKVIISGEEKIAKEEVEFLVEKRLENKILFFPTKSIWAIDTKQIKKDILDAFPQIAAAEVKKSFFDAINLQITERKPSALWCENENCFLLDNEGVIFEEASADSGLIIVESAKSADELFLGKAVIEKEKLAQILEIKSKLAEVAKISAEKATLLFEERLNVKTSEGWEIYFNLKGDLNWQLTELAVVLEKQISSEKRGKLEYIDLRFSRVYYK